MAGKGHGKGGQKRSERESTSSSLGEPESSKARTQAPSHTTPAVASSSIQRPATPESSSHAPPTGRPLKLTPMEPGEGHAAGTETPAALHRATQSDERLPSIGSVFGQAAHGAPAQGQSYGQSDPQTGYAGYGQPASGQPQINPIGNLQPPGVQAQHHQAGHAPPNTAQGPRPERMPVDVGQVQDHPWALNSPGDVVLTAPGTAETDPAGVYSQGPRNFITRELTRENWRAIIALARTCKIRKNGHAEQVTYNIEEAVPLVAPQPGEGPWQDRMRQLMEQPTKYGWVVLAMALFTSNAPSVDLLPNRARLVNLLDCRTPERSGSANFQNDISRADPDNLEWAASWIQWKLVFGGATWSGPSNREYWWTGNWSRGKKTDMNWNIAAGAKAIHELWTFYKQNKRARLERDYPEMTLPR